MVMDKETAMSFQEWSIAGFRIKKGAKSQIRDALNIPQFTRDQVFDPDEPEADAYYAKQARHSSSQWEQSDTRAKAKGTPRGVIEDFDSFVREAGMLPDLSHRPVFSINSPLEQHFMNVADKHGILDRIIDGEEDEW